MGGCLSVGVSTAKALYVILLPPSASRDFTCAFEVGGEVESKALAPPVILAMG